MGQFINMKKKLNKLICIFLCILLISLSIVPVFATDFYFNNDKAAFVSAFNNAITFTATQYTSTYFVDNYGLDWSPLYNKLVDQYSIPTTDIQFLTMDRTSSVSVHMYIFTSSKDMVSSYPTNLTSSSPGLSIVYPANTIKYRYEGTYNTSTEEFTNFSSYNSTGNSAGWTFGTRANFAGVVPFKITISPNSSYIDWYYMNDPAPSNGGGGSGGDVNVGDIGDVNWVNFASLLASYLASNYTFTVNGTTYNQSYANVGWALAYMFECMENPTLSTITLDNSTMINPVNCLLYGDTTNPTLFDNIKTETVYISSVLDDIEDHGERIGDYLMDLASIYASEQEVEAREAAADNQQAVVDNFLDSQGDGSVSASNLGELADSSAEIKSNFNTGYSASGVWDVFDRNWDWFSNTTKNNLEPPAQNTRSANDYETPFLDNAINEILRLRGN